MKTFTGIYSDYYKKRVKNFTFFKSIKETYIHEDYITTIKSCYFLSILLYNRKTKHNITINDIIKDRIRFRLH